MMETHRKSPLIQADALRPGETPETRIFITQVVHNIFLAGLENGLNHDPLVWAICHAATDIYNGRFPLTPNGDHE